MRVLDDPVASPKESPAAPEASTVPDISGGLLSSLHRLVRRVSYGRRSCGTVPAQNGDGGSCLEPGVLFHKTNRIGVGCWRYCLGNGASWAIVPGGWAP